VSWSISSKKPRSNFAPGLKKSGKRSLLERRLFFHPDFTVDPGISPGPADSARGLYHRSGIGKFSSLTLPRRIYLIDLEYIFRISACQAEAIFAQGNRIKMKMARELQRRREKNKEE